MVRLRGKSRALSSSFRHHVYYPVRIRVFRVLSVGYIKGYVLEGGSTRP